MIARQIDDKELLDFWAGGADAGGVTKIDSKSEALECNFLKEGTIP